MSHFTVHLTTTCDGQIQVEADDAKSALDKCTRIMRDDLEIYIHDDDWQAVSVTNAADEMALSLPDPFDLHAAQTLCLVAGKLDQHRDAAAIAVLLQMANELESTLLYGSKTL